MHSDPERPWWLPPEQRVFRAYCEVYPGSETGAGRPALLPQVYLHMDPRTRKERGNKDRALGRDVWTSSCCSRTGPASWVEVDGEHHCDRGRRGVPRRYAKMVAEDRALRLKGYEVYRFGGEELGLNSAPAMLRRSRQGQLRCPPQQPARPVALGVAPGDVPGCGSVSMVTKGVLTTLSEEPCLPQPRHDLDRVS
jgi:hypothetical protein